MGHDKLFTGQSMRNEDILQVPKVDVLSKISTPNISRTGRVYQITDEEFDFLSQIKF